MIPSIRRRPGLVIRSDRFQRTTYELIERQGNNVWLARASGSGTIHTLNLSYDQYSIVPQRTSPPVRYYSRDEGTSWYRDGANPEVQSILSSLGERYDLGRNQD